VNIISTGDIYEHFPYKLATYTYQPATSPVCKIHYFVARVDLVGLVGCAVDFRRRVGLRLGLR